MKTDLEEIVSGQHNDAKYKELKKDHKKKYKTAPPKCQFKNNPREIQNLLDKKLKAFQNDTYNELNRYGDLKIYRFYQFVVAYKKALEEYYKEFIYS